MPENSFRFAANFGLGLRGQSVSRCRLLRGTPTTHGDCGWIVGFAALAWAVAAMAQDSPPHSGPLNPPPLPATSPAGRLGTAANLPINNSTFPNPGSTWTPLGPAPLNEGGSASGRIAAVAVDPTNSSNIYVAAAGGGVWQSANGGSSWNPLTDNQASLAMGAIAIAPSNHLKIYAGTGEANNSLDSNFGLGILVSNDGGASWTLSTGPNNAFNRRAIGMISVESDYRPGCLRGGG